MDRELSPGGSAVTAASLAVMLGVFVVTTGLLVTGVGLVGALGTPAATVTTGTYPIVLGLVGSWSLTYARSLRYVEPAPLSIPTRPTETDKDTYLW